MRLKNLRMSHAWLDISCGGRDTDYMREIVRLIETNTSQRPRGSVHNEGVTFTLESNADFGRRAILLNAENSGIPAAT